MLNLAIVMPVYNEAEIIREVISAWLSTLGSMGISYRILIFDDGSTDNTREILAQYESNKNIEIIHQPNRGHGPTILRGYRYAVTIADWVFQCDSDNEMDPRYFLKLWEERHHNDALFGVRKSRKQSLHRKVITFFSTLMVRWLFGRGVSDVNTPYRLIRADALKTILNDLPDDIAAPNIIISGMVCRRSLRIFEYPVPHRNRKTGTSSVISLKLFRLALKSFWQVLSYGK